VRYNASGLLILRVPFATTIHGREGLSEHELRLRVAQSVKGYKSAATLMEIVETDDVPDWPTALHTALARMTVDVGMVHPGDPPDCDCGACERDERENSLACPECAKGRVRLLVSGDYACSKCGHLWLDKDRLERVNTGEDCPKEDTNTCPDCGSTDTTCPDETPFGRECRKCQCTWTVFGNPNKCKHDLDYSTIRPCSKREFLVEVQCRSCKRWGAVAVDHGSVQFEVES